MGQSTTWKETCIKFKKMQILGFEQKPTKFTEIFIP